MGFGRGRRTARRYRRLLSICQHGISLGLYWTPAFRRSPGSAVGREGHPNHGGCHMGWHRSHHCLGPGCCVCKVLPVIRGSSLRVALEAFLSMGLGDSVAMSHLAPRKGELVSLTSPTWDWPWAEVAAERLTACLDRKQGKGNSKSLPLQAHGRKAAGSCSPQKQHLQLSHPWAPGKSPPQAAPRDVSHTPGRKMFPICLV